MRSTKESVVLIRLGCLSCPRALASATSFMFHTSARSNEEGSVSSRELVLLKEPSTGSELEKGVEEERGGQTHEG